MGMDRAAGMTVSADGDDLDGASVTQSLYHLSDTHYPWIYHDDIDPEFQRSGNRKCLLGIQSRHCLATGLAEYLAQPKDETKVRIENQDDGGHIERSVNTAPHTLFAPQLEKGAACGAKLMLSDLEGDFLRIAANDAPADFEIQGTDSLQ